MDGAALHHSTRTGQSRSSPPNTAIFVALTGQRDNIGDSLLRRGLLASLPSGRPRHVLVGPDSDDYRSGLGLAEHDVVYQDRRAWMKALISAAVRGRVGLAMNAGEMSPDRAFVRARLALVPLTWLVRLRRGFVIQAGLGVRNPAASRSIVISRLLASAELVVWRDEASRAWAGRGTVAPDWAFKLGANRQVLESRHALVASPRMVISMRGDRPEPSGEVIASLKEALRATSSEPVVVCQVRRDGERAAWLAEQLAAELVPWPDERSHAEQEAVLRSEYADATWVTSDRLHVLIAAMTEGAVPIAVVPDTNRKVARTLAGLDIVPVSPNHAAEQLVRSRRDLRDALVSAQARLQQVERGISTLVEGYGTPRPVRVLHSVALPDSTTRYATHMAATEDLNLRPVFFTWRRALIGRYERFHLHWPEHLVPGGATVRARVRRLLARALIHRLERRQIPVLRTLHNLVPHDAAGVSEASRLHQRLEAVTRVDIHLVEGDPERPEAASVFIPHGSYREPYAAHPVGEKDPGRVLFFGMLKRYKGIPELLAAFAQLEGGSLRIVGAPADSAVVAAVRDAAEADPRVSADFGFITDAALAAEIGAAELVALPYHELHSSGVVLVALSLSRPVLVPRTTTTEALMREVGTQWVRMYDGPLTVTELEAAQSWAAGSAQAPAPDLANRSWATVRALHGATYASL